MTGGTFLTDTAFKALADEQQPLVEPFDPKSVQPASIDLRLSGERVVYKRSSYRLGEEMTDHDFERQSFDELSVNPGETVFVGLAEKIAIPKDAVGFVFARSSLTRLGLVIAPVFMNPGYSGRMPLTLTNSASFVVTLVPGVRIAQLVCARLSSVPEKLYSGDEVKYAEEDLSPSQLHNDAEIKAALRGVLEGYFPRDFVRNIA